MELSQRLKTVASLVKYRSIADIGTDHGYIPCYLAYQNNIDKAIACDVNKGPLNKASENVSHYNFGEIIETRLGSGLEPLNKGEAETVIIAGMGGLLICDILKKGADKVQDIKQLILQPQRDIYSVRKLIHQLGFKIDDELMLCEGGKYYNIISAVKGSEYYTDELYYYFGKKLIGSKSPVLKEYVTLRLNKYQSILENASRKSESNADMSELKKSVSMYLEVLKRYDMQ